jgi:pyrroloquinoline quinone (PQQ) biosynthesis protein C
VAESTIESFVDQVTRELEQEGRDVLKHPAMRALADGSLPLEGLQNWARQFWHCIKNSARSFALVHANLPEQDLDLRRELAANIFEEDAGGISGTDNHNALFLEFVDAIGLPRDDVIHGERGAEAATLMGEFEVQALTREQALEWLCIRGVGMERANAGICAAMGEALRKHYGLKPEQTRFFDVHATIDEDHGDFAVQVLQRLGDSRQRRAELEEKIVAGAELFYHVWDTALSPGTAAAHGG